MRRTKYPPDYDHRDLGLRATMDGRWIGNSSAMWQVRRFAEQQAGVHLEWTEIDDGDDYCRGLLTTERDGHVYRIERLRAQPTPTAGPGHLGQ